MGYRKILSSLFAAALFIVLYTSTLQGKIEVSSSHGTQNKTSSTSTKEPTTKNHTYSKGAPAASKNLTLSSSILSNATNQGGLADNENTSPANIHTRTSADSSSSMLSNMSSQYHSKVHICQSPKVDLRNGVKKVVPYQCTGTAYNKFAESLLSLNEASNISAWGKRDFPIPDNRHILFFGNSHTRQVLETLICQYEDDISFGTLSDESHNAGYVRFTNNATVHWLINSWVTFSTNWTTDYMDELPHPYPLDSYDVIVLGQFNPLAGGDSHYVREMRQKSKIHPSMNVHKRPPTLDELDSQVSSRVHLVGVPMLTLRDGKESGDFLRAKENMPPNRSVTVINPRRYVPQLGECGARYMFSVNRDCLNTTEARNELHKCAGSRGGFADPVSWDLIEVLTDLLELE